MNDGKEPKRTIKELLEHFKTDSSSFSGKQIKARGFLLILPAESESVKKMLEIGIKGHMEQVVTQELTAIHIDSGAVRVFATAMMIAMMENACRTSVKPYLESGQETVGTHVDVSHVSATPVGMKVWCDSELIAIDRRKLIFRVAAYDEAGLIGEGRHERFVIDEERFAAKTESKRQR